MSLLRLNAQCITDLAYVGGAFISTAFYGVAKNSCGPLILTFVYILE